MKSKHLLQLGAGILISAAALWYVFRGVPLREFLGAFTTFKYIWLLPAASVFYFGIWLRGLRWRWLFQPKNDIPLMHTVGGIFICFAFNSVFPARAGEFARCYLVGKRDKTGFSTAFGTVVSERLLDGITILGLFVAAVCLAHKSLIAPDLVKEVEVFGRSYKFTGSDVMRTVRGIVVLSAALIVFIGMISIPSTRGLILRVLHAFTFVPSGIRNKMETAINRFSEGLESLHSPARLLKMAFVSLFVWLTNAASIMLIGWGFDFAVSFEQSIVLLFIMSLFVMASPTPGYWGFFEAGLVIGVSLLGIHEKDPSVVSYAIFVHLLQWLPIVLIGLPWAWLSHVSLSDAESVEAESEKVEAGQSA